MSNKTNNRLDTWGNEQTMNLNAIIYQNILSSPYFRSLFDKKTFHEIVDEIYNEVYVLSPFLKGTQPSTAFCLLFKMWTLRLTIRQIENMIDHVDSPYIRAIGFLYLRYVCAPAQLWDWFQYYLEDEEEIVISSGINPTKITIGKLCRMLLTEQKYQGTMLPRIPVPIARDLTKKLEDYDREHRNKSKKYRSDSDDDQSRYRSRSPGRDSDKHRDELDDYERRRRHRDRSRSKGSRHDDDRDSRRRSVSPGYRRRDHHSRSRDRYAQTYSKDSRRY